MNKISTIILFVVILIFGGCCEYKTCELERAKQGLEKAYYLIWNNNILDSDGSDEMQDFLEIYCELNND